MKTEDQKTALILDFASVAFDGTADHVARPREISRLATLAATYAVRGVRIFVRSRTTRKTPSHF